jgi:hypothetical protein
MVKRLRNRLAGLMMAILCVVGAVSAQSPNTASMVVTVVDQNDAVVKGANVSVVNNATGASREAASGDEGTATLMKKNLLLIPLAVVLLLGSCTGIL